MDKLIHKLVEVNISKGKISNEEAEIFTYGYRLLVEKILIFLISIFVAALCDAFFEIVLLYISFVPLRTYCGGISCKKQFGLHDIVWSIFDIGNIWYQNNGI